MRRCSHAQRHMQPTTIDILCRLSEDIVSRQNNLWLHARFLLGFGSVWRYFAASASSADKKDFGVAGCLARNSHQGTKTPRATAMKQLIVRHGSVSLLRRSSPFTICFAAKEFCNRFAARRPLLHCSNAAGNAARMCRGNADGLRVCFFGRRCDRAIAPTFSRSGDRRSLRFADEILALRKNFRTRSDCWSCCGRRT